MKQTILRFSGKKFITAAFLSASILLSSVAVNATSAHNNIEILSGGNTNVQLTETTSDALIFRVHINNKNGNSFTINIKNDAGDVLFSKSFNDADFQKQFK